MKTKFMLPIAILLFKMNLTTEAQNNVCSNLFINSIQSDSTDTTVYQINVQYNGAPNEVINYPVASLVIDCQGDTIGNGFGFWFGQMGQTTQDYPFHLTGNFGCMPITVIFTYLDAMGNPDSCTLVYNLSGIEKRSVSEPLLVFPNPCKDRIFIEAGLEETDSSYQIFDLQGRTLVKGKLEELSTEIIIETWPSGVYFLRCDADPKQVHKIVKTAQ